MSSRSCFSCLRKPTPEERKNSEQAQEARKEVMRVRRIQVDKEKELKEEKVRQEKERKVQEALEAEVLQEATERLAKERREAMVVAKMEELRTLAPPVKIFDARPALQVAPAQSSTIE